MSDEQSGKFHSGTRSETVVISRRTYEKQIQVLKELNARCLTLKAELQARDKTIESLEKASRDQKKGVPLRKDNVNWEERCHQLQRILDRQDEETGVRLESDELNREISKLRADINLKKNYIQDLEHQIGGQGASSEQWMEFRKKNDRLLKIIANKEDLLKEHEIAIADLQEQLVQARLSASAARGPVTDDGHPCPNCASTQAAAVCTNDRLYALQEENSYLRALKTRLEANLSRVREDLLTQCQVLNEDLARERSISNQLKLQLDLSGVRLTRELSTGGQYPSTNPSDSASTASSYQIPKCTRCHQCFATKDELNKHSCRARP